jgi:U3 small nucleolar RNA-associated protein 11
MVGSALRHAVHRRNHKVRVQLVNRSGLELLEKKKDYVQHARDYRSKKLHLKRKQQPGTKMNFTFR